MRTTFGIPRSCIGILPWQNGAANKYHCSTGRELICVSETYFRPAEVDELLGDSTKARLQLGWKPEYSFDDLLREMVETDCP
jgi:GDPmannose 4,6-dehydratase